MRKLLLMLLAIGGLLAGVAWWINAPRQTAVSQDIFTFAPLSRGDMVESVSATGRLKPTRTVVVSSEAAGTVVNVFSEVNQVVRPGDELAKLDSRLAQLKYQQACDAVEIAEAAVAQAEAKEKAAKLAYEYQLELKNKGGFRTELDKARVEWDAAKAGVALARAKVQEAVTHKEQAKLGLNKMVLHVPGSKSDHAVGWSSAQPNPLQVLGHGDAGEEFLILEKNVQVGQMVGPQAPEPLFLLAGNLNRMEVHTEVVEGDIGKVKKGLEALFTISSYAEPDRKFKGQVREIRPTPTSVRGAVYYNAVIDVANEKNPETKEWRLRPGMTASVDIVLRRHTNVWRVPAAALNFQMEEAYQSPEAQERLAAWKQRPDWSEWRPVWVWQADHERVWPVFIRLSDTKNNRTSIQNGEFHEVLEWEPGFTPQLGMPLITSAPPAAAPGLFDRPANLKLS